MANIRFSAFAEANLLAIYDYTEAAFGEYQAEGYLSGLDRTFGLLADFPRIGQTADDLRKGYRRFRFQSHFVFYTIDADGITVRAVLHTAVDIRSGSFPD